MQASGICFAHRWDDGGDGTEYVAPDLLPEGRTGPPEALAARWDPIAGEPLTVSMRYPFLSPSIGRTALSQLGQLGHDSALYWRYGLCLYDAESRASAILEAVADRDEAADPSGNPGYGGRLRLRVKGQGAERLLAALIERLQRLNRDHGWAGAPEDSGTQGTGPHARGLGESAGDGSDLTRLTLAAPPAEPPGTPEVYVSFAWKQDRAEPLVGDLIEGLAEHGIRVLRDSDQLQPGDSISSFMRRLSAGRCVLLVISHAYLRSPFCMTELQGIWTNARQSERLFRKRVVPLVQTDAAIGTLKGRVAHAAYWQQEHAEIDALIRRHGAEVVGAEDFRRFKLIGDFYRHVGDILSFADDVLVPRDRPTLSRESFAVVRDLIERALE
jgi:internalin A